MSLGSPNNRLLCFTAFSPKYIATGNLIRKCMTAREELELAVGKADSSTCPRRKSIHTIQPDNPVWGHGWFKVNDYIRSSSVFGYSPLVQREAACYMGETQYLKNQLPWVQSCHYPDQTWELRQMFHGCVFSQLRECKSKPKWDTTK